MHSAAISNVRWTQEIPGLFAALPEGILALQPSTELPCCCFLGALGGSWPWYFSVEFLGSKLLNLWLDRSSNECCIAESFIGVICAKNEQNISYRVTFPVPLPCIGTVDYCTLYISPWYTGKKNIGTIIVFQSLSSALTLCVPFWSHPGEGLLIPIVLETFVGKTPGPHVSFS